MLIPNVILSTACGQHNIHLKYISIQNINQVSNIVGQPIYCIFIGTMFYGFLLFPITYGQRYWNTIISGLNDNFIWYEFNIILR